MRLKLSLKRLITYRLSRNINRLFDRMLFWPPSIVRLLMILQILMPAMDAWKPDEPEYTGIPPISVNSGPAQELSFASFQPDTTKQKIDTPPQETRFYITSLSGVNADDFSRWIRSHRRMENQLHRVSDMASNEDRRQKRAKNSAGNFFGMLRLARNILKRYKDLHSSRISYRSMMLRTALNPAFASEVIQHDTYFHDTSPMRLL